ncbi:MAG: [FeFe] hydrogenase H-cluster maturation GTPase HydF, partial [Victivallaceae bacterium]
MISTPKSLRLQIAIFGRTNVGKSTLMNLLCGQNVAITSAVPGTTTDVVEKAMELIPLGPVLFLDTAGFDDNSELGDKRIERTVKAFDRADVALLIVSPACWGAAEERICALAEEHKINLMIIVNKIDLQALTPDFMEFLKSRSKFIITTSATGESRDMFLNKFKDLLIAAAPEDFLQPPPFLADLVVEGGMVVLIVPIDSQAPKGRLILPQVQTVRDALDCDCVCVVVKENRYVELLKELKNPPDLVVCDSQVVDFMVANTPKNIKCTTFSIIFSRLKGDIKLFYDGAMHIKDLKDGDRILVAEACTHHATCDDIGRVKIPRWLKNKLNINLEFDFVSGGDFPADLSAYKLIIQCGSCMINRRETLRRMENARSANIPIVNYGMCISWCQGVLYR